MAKIEINGETYRVADNMGFNHSIGMYAKSVETADGTKVAVKPRGGEWRFWSAVDRTAPLRAAFDRGETE